MIFKLIGYNTLDGIRLQKKLVQIANYFPDRVTIRLLNAEDKGEIPILYLNDKLISQGKLPTEKELLKTIKKNL